MTTRRSKMGKRIRKKIENSVDRLRVRVDHHAPVAYKFWDAPELDTCFDILVLTCHAVGLATVEPADRNGL